MFNRNFVSKLLGLALPITLQQAVMAIVQLLDVMMIGQMGEVAIAAVGLANQFYFIYMITVFGIGSGAGIFVAQYWGKRDLASLRKVMGLGLLAGLFFAVIFTSLASFKPDLIMSLYTGDHAVIAAGIPYLRLSAVYYPLTAISFLYAVVLRSTGNVKLPVTVSMAVLSLKVLLNYLFIFGNLGFPAMGILGAALATLIVRVLETIILLFFSYRLRTPAAARLAELRAFNRDFANRFYKVTFPVILNESLWSIGISVYQGIYARIGTQSVAAVNIASSIESLTFVFFMGLAHSMAVILGNEIGAGDEANAQADGKRAIVIAMVMAILLGLMLIFGAPHLLPLYKITDESMRYARNILLIMGLAGWIRGSNGVILVGILRSGGDTRFAFLAEFISMWIFGIPLAAFGAFVLHLEVHWVYVMVLLDEFIKLLVGLWRYRSGKWIHNLVGETLPAPVESGTG